MFMNNIVFRRGKGFVFVYICLQRRERGRIKGKFVEFSWRFRKKLGIYRIVGFRWLNLILVSFFFLLQIFQMRYDILYIYSECNRVQEMIVLYVSSIKGVREICQYVCFLFDLCRGVWEDGLKVSVECRDRLVLYLLNIVFVNSFRCEEF